MIFFCFDEIYQLNLHKILAIWENVGSFQNLCEAKMFVVKSKRQKK